MVACDTIRQKEGGLMGMLRTILRILITSAGLALWELFLKDIYVGWLQASGKAYGFGEAMLGYFAILSCSYIFSVFLTRGIDDGGA
jgi:hypothetical protein